MKIYSVKNYLFILAFFSLIACAGKKNAETNLPSPTVEEVKMKKTKKKVALSMKKELLTEGEVVLDVAYPQFKNVGNEQTTASLNSMIKTMIDTTISGFKNEADGIDGSATDKIDTIMVADKEKEMYKGMANTLGRSLFIGYFIRYQTPEYIEIEFGFDIYAGGAHGMPSRKMIHFDVAANKKLTLKDIFVENSDYLGQISTLTAAELNLRKDEMGTDEESIGLGTEPKEDNFSKFTILRDSLNILFDPYAVASYAAGPQVSKIPLSKLESIINKNSVVIKVKK